MELKFLDKKTYAKHPAKMSVSEIAHKKYEPMEKFELASFRKNSTKGLLSATELGTQIHKVFQLLDFKKLGNEDEFNRQIDGFKSRKLLHKEIDKQFDLMTIYKFFSTELGKRLLASQQIYRERAFILEESYEKIDLELKEGKILIQGVIDCYFIEGGVAVVIDFKSDQVGEDIEVPEPYRIQVSYYAKAVEQLTGIPVTEKYIYYIRTMQSKKI
jgi:ATP-dependent helicase/nuclease subunit A